MASSAENELKMLMKGRAGVWGLLAEILEEEPSIAAVDNLLLYLDDLFENVEFTEGDHLTEGYAKLKNWRAAAEDVEKPWLENTLSDEYASLFLTNAPLERSLLRRAAAEGREIKDAPRPESASDREDGPCETALRDYYSRHGYADGENSADPFDVAVMADFMRHMAENSSEAASPDEAENLLKTQTGFMKNVLMNDLPGFCQEMYEKSSDYGIYQYVALILNGFANFDNAVVEMALNRKN